MNIKTNNIRIEKLVTFLRRLFCVPKCASCQKRLPAFTDRDILNRGIPCFCEQCLSSWCREKTEMCHNCGKTAPECTCIPHGCTIKQATVPSLFFYHPNKDCAASKAVFTLKHKKHTDLYMFLSEELSEEIEKALKKADISPSSCIFTYIPRSLSGIRENGFDQSMNLTRRICKRTGGRFIADLIKRDGGKEQKKLSPKERKVNAERSFLLNPSAYDAELDVGDGNAKPLTGKTVVLIDDVMTSGASASICVGILKSAGADMVLFASVARCEVKKRK